MKKPVTAYGRSWFPRSHCQVPEPPSFRHFTSHAPIIGSKNLNRPATADGLSRFAKFLRLPVYQQPRQHMFPTSFVPYNTNQPFDWSSASCMEWVRQLWLKTDMKGKAFRRELNCVSDSRWLINAAYPENVDDGPMKPEERKIAFDSIASFLDTILDANNRVHEWTRGGEIAHEIITLAPTDPVSCHHDGNSACHELYEPCDEQRTKGHIPRPEVINGSDILRLVNRPLGEGHQCSTHLLRPRSVHRKSVADDRQRPFWRTCANGVSKSSTTLSAFIKSAPKAAKDFVCQVTPIMSQLRPAYTKSYTKNSVSLRQMKKLRSSLSTVIGQYLVLQMMRQGQKK